MDDTTAPQPVAIEANEPIAPVAAPAAAEKKPGNAKNVALLVGAGVVGGLLVLGAGAAGYAIGHADNGGRHDMAFAGDRVPGGQQNGQNGGGMMGGQNGRGVDPDGDNWTGGGMMGGQNGRGVDPDGDNWSGGGMQGQNGGGMHDFGQGMKDFGQGLQDFGNGQRNLGDGADQLRNDIQQFMQQFMQQRGNA